MLINREAFLLFLVVFETRFAGVTRKAAAMASSKATSSTQVPRAHHFELVEGMQLQVVIFCCADELWIYLILCTLWKS